MATSSRSTGAWTRFRQRPDGAPGSDASRQASGEPRETERGSGQTADGSYEAPPSTPESPGYHVERMSRARRALAAGQESARHKHTMFALVEADVTLPRELIRDHLEATGEHLSLTAYVTTCLARALAEFPRLNAFRRGRSLVFLDEVIVEVLLERRIEGQAAVGYLPIRHADTKTLRQVHDEIRAGQAARHETIAGERWLALVPPIAARPLMWWMRRSPHWALRFGVAGVNNLGMGTTVGGWGLSPGAGTLGVTIGGISRRLEWEDGRLSEHEIAHLTLAFDHDVIDGAPAARFTSRLLELLAAGESLRVLMGEPGRPDAADRTSG